MECVARRSGRPLGGILALGLVGSLALSSCSAPLTKECGDAGGCAQVVVVPTSSRAEHVGSGAATVEGTLEAEVRGGQVCLLVNRGAAVSSLNLVLPVGTRSTPLGDLPSFGRANLRLLGNNDFGGVETGDRITVTADHREKDGRVGGCITGPTVYSGSLVARDDATAQ